MRHDGCYDTLEVKRTIKANTIIAKSIQLEDTTLESSPNLLASKVKLLYESQPNTNPFTDSDKRSLTSLNNHTNTIDSGHSVINSVQFVKLFRDTEIDNELMPDNTTCICLDSQDQLIHKIKLNGCISYSKTHNLQSHISPQLNVSEESGHVSVNLQLG